MGKFLQSLAVPAVKLLQSKLQRYPVNILTIVWCPFEFLLHVDMVL